MRFMRHDLDERSALLGGSRPDLARGSATVVTKKRYSRTKGSITVRKSPAYTRRVEVTVVPMEWRQYLVLD